MKKFLSLSLFSGLILFSCTKENSTAVTPCIQDKLAAFESTQACSEGASVTRYTFQGQMVYVFNPGYCAADLTSDVCTEDCDYLGYLGGISGNDTISGVNFPQTAITDAVIWNN